MMSDDTTTSTACKYSNTLGSTTTGSNLPAKKQRETEGELGGLYLVRTAALF